MMSRGPHSTPIVSCPWLRRGQRRRGQERSGSGSRRGGSRAVVPSALCRKPCSKQVSIAQTAAPAGKSSGLQLGASAPIRLHFLAIRNLGPRLLPAPHRTATYLGELAGWVGLGRRVQATARAVLALRGWYGGSRAPGHQGTIHCVASKIPPTPAHRICNDCEGFGFPVFRVVSVLGHQCSCHFSATTLTIAALDRTLYLGCRRRKESCNTQQATHIALRA